VPVNGADQNALQVFAFSNDMTPQDPVIPPHFDVSFNRTILNASITVTPAAQPVGAGDTVPLTAVVTGLPASDVTWSANGGTLVPNGASASWTAPASKGVYTITAFAASNPTFRAYAVMTEGGAVCDPKLTGQRFAGLWNATGTARIFGNPGIQNCTTVPEFYGFEQDGVMQIVDNGNATGDLLLVSPGGLRSWSGEFQCDPQDQFLGVNGESDVPFGLNFGTVALPDDPNIVSGSIRLQLAATPKIVPCVSEVETFRQ
jgi:hypothetical protein